MRKNQWMKLRSAMMGLAICGVVLCGCNTNGNSQTEGNPSDSGSETEITTQEQTNQGNNGDASTENTTEAGSESGQKEAITEAELSRLFEENLNCMLYIFELGDLPHEEEPMDGDMIYRVTDDEFQSLADLEEYLLTVYTKEEADRLLYQYPYEDQSKYLEQDGVLCINMALSGGKGYYVDWTDFEVRIKTIDEDRCTFLVKGTIEEPADEPILEEYYSEGAAVYENGHWVLEEMMY